MKSKLVLLAMCLILCFLTITSASASEIDNTTAINDNPEININQETNFEENTLISTETDLLNAKSDGTFTDLANDIANAGSTLKLNRNYVRADGESGVHIDKSIVIEGNGYTLSGSNHTRIFTVDASNVVINNINFVNGHSYEGGSINWRGDYGILNNCSFINSSTIGYGGAVYWDADDGVLNNCNFVNTSTVYGGGAVYWDNFNGVLANSTFVNSYCTKNGQRSGGGAIWWAAQAYYGSVYNCIFVDCSSYATKGGSISWIGAYGTLSNCIFKNSQSQDMGGAVYWNSYSGVVNESSFTNCYAKNVGGGIYFCKGTHCTLINSNFEGNVALKGGEDWYGFSDLIVINDTKTSTVITAPGVTTTYGVSKNMVATLKDIDNNILAGEEISIVLNNVKYPLKTNSKGQASLAIPTDLAPKTYVATISYAGNDEYASSTTTANVVVNKADTSISAVYNANANEVVATLTNANTGKAISGTNVKFSINGATTSVKTNSKGQAKFSTAGLSSGTVKISYAGNSKYKSSSTSIVISVKSDIIISAVYDADNNELVATLTNEATGKAVSSASVQVNINGATTTVKTDTKGQAKVSTAGLPLGTNTATISYAGNSKYNSASTSISFDVKTKVIVTDVYAYSDKIVAKLTNGATGKTIANANMIVEINGVKYNAKSDNKGQLTFNTTDLDLPNSYDLTISYRGNDRYTASSATVAVDLDKANMMITTNYHADKQKLVATLKNSKTGKVVSNANMIIDLNGVKTTYKSNDQGKITLPTVDFAPGTYVGTVTYPGNARYNSISAVFKVDI